MDNQSEFDISSFRIKGDVLWCPVYIICNHLVVTCKDINISQFQMNDIAYTRNLTLSRSVFDACNTYSTLPWMEFTISHITPSYEGNLLLVRRVSTDI